MRLLALDIGKRRTGVAYFDDATGFPLPLDTLQHTSVDDCLRQITALAQERSVTHLLLGLPYLPDGTEGEQAFFVRDIQKRLELAGFSVVLLDERYSTDSSKYDDNAMEYDKDAAAATTLLSVYLDRRKGGVDK